MKIEIGMYVRYKNFTNISKIAKITKIELSNDDCYENYYHFDNEDGTLEGFIEKASYNIIDLIKEGDYVNECQVIAVNVKGEFVIIGYGMDGTLFMKDIKSIVTHEQFESMKYEVK